MKSNFRKGVQLALATALFSGVANFVNKFAVSTADPLVFTTLKNTLVAFIVIGLLILACKLPKIRSLSRRDIIQLLAIAVIGGSLPFYLFFTALKEMPAINAALIHKTLVLWVALLAVPLLRERVSSLQLGAIGLIYSVNLLTGTFKGVSFQGPELMVLVATLLWAVENVIAKVTLRRVDPDIVVGARMGLGSLILVLVVIILGKGSQLFTFTPQQFSLTLLTSFLLFGYVATWYRALKLAPVTLVATVLTSATLVTNLLTGIFVSHTFDLQQFAEAVFVSAGLWFFLTVSRRVLSNSPERATVAQANSLSLNAESQ